jgi:uncharacterized membrane protein YidH (DUF202 family)
MKNNNNNNNYNNSSNLDLTQQHLANERTFLAWVRTCIALIGLGFIISKFSFFLVKFRTISKIILLVLLTWQQITILKYQDQNNFLLS